MGPLLALIFLALWYRNMVIERISTKRKAAAAEVINQRWPLLVWYQGASSVGQISQT